MNVQASRNIWNATSIQFIPFNNVRNISREIDIILYDIVTFDFIIYFGATPIFMFAS